MLHESGGEGVGIQGRGYLGGERGEREGRESGEISTIMMEYVFICCSTGLTNRRNF
jgi:hypothetical protein